MDVKTLDISSPSSGRTVTSCEVEIRTASGTLVAKALGNYEVG
jgi:acyl-coenzyme A thioesterase PaaI-like protein